jgi:2-polyprenyl-3-methyl-5-hydroxy-6-metoxy-1,4-benzoquinol methylase
MYSYRKIFYTKYFETQAGRRLDADDLKKVFAAEVTAFGKEILPHIRKEKTAKILDIGCGYGQLVKALQLAGWPQTEGIDLSPDMVSQAETFGVKGVQQADLLTFLEAHKNTYDVITGMDIIEHFGKDELTELLMKVNAALKPDGVAVFRTPNTDAAFFTIYSYGDFTHENYMNGSSALQVMYNTGYKEAYVFASRIEVPGMFKELLRKALWKLTTLRYKLELFASGRSSKNIIFTPNMLVIGVKK